MRKAHSNSSNRLTKEVFKSPAKLIISLILVIFIIDIGVTFLLRAIPIYSHKLAGLIDGLILVILIGPALYYLVFRPMLQFLIRNTRLLKEDQVLYEITEGVTSTSNLVELLKLIHTSISKVLYAENCFFALYNHEKNQFSFPYFVDKYDEPPKGELSLEKSCTAYVLRKGKSMLVPGNVFQQLIDKGEAELVGSFSPSWVGIPLRTSSKIIGVLVLQHYEKEDVYDEGHLRFLDSIASQLANVIERKRAEEELEQSISLLTATLEATADGLVVVDKNRHIINFNRKFVEQWNIPDSIDKKFGSDEIRAIMENQIRDPEGVKKFNNRVYLDENRTSFDLLECRDGRVFERCSQPQHSDGKVIGRVWSYRDITERKKAELELQENEEKFRTIFERSPIGIEIYDANGIQVDINNAALEIFGIAEKEDSLGFDLFSGTSLTTELKEKLMHGNRIDYTASFDFEKVKSLNQYETSRQGIRELHYFITPLKSNDKVALGYLMLVQDITERKKADDLLKESEIRLRELNASKDKFFSIIAHDLKSPFNAILGFSDLLVEKIQDKDYDGIEELVDLIQKSSGRTLNLLMNLLEWARSQSGKVKPQQELIHAGELVSEATEALNDVAEHKSIAVSIEISEGDKIYADKAMAGTVVRNIVSNAIKFTGIGGKITITATEKGDGMLFTIKDNGVGMDKEDLEKLFMIDESFSSPGTLNEKGTGLGLLICKEFVEKNGGRIWAESEPGKGSTFCFTFPSKISHAPRPPV